MALNLNNHLLETVDDLFATLLGHLLLEVVLSALSLLTTLLLLVLRNIGVRLLLGLFFQVLDHALVRPLLLGLVGGILAFVGRNLLATLVLGLGLLLHAFEVRGFVPCVVLSGSINVVELVFGWVDLVGRLLRTITGNVTSKYETVLDYEKCQ